MFSDDLPGLADPSTNRADDEKVDAVIAFLTESHLDTFGGYPHDYMEFRGWVIIADLDDGKERNRTVLRTYKRKTLIRWYDDAVSEYGGSPDDEDSTFIDALFETQPDEDVTP